MGNEGQARTSEEKRKMLAGELYDASDPMLTGERLQARRLTFRYNSTPPDEVHVRAEILRELLGTKPEVIKIEPPFHCDYGYNIRVGERFFANFGCIMLDVAPITIGEDVAFGPNVQLLTATHPVEPKQRLEGPELGAPIQIGDAVWLGGGVIVCPGVSIGAGTTIGAGSVVTKDVPARVVAVGNPCRVLKPID
jgi:maltose O-acetyltransferase